MAYKTTKRKEVSLEASVEPRKTETLYAIDLGVGFTKRTLDGLNVHTEPSVFSEVPEFNNSSKHYFSVDKKFHYFLGNNVTEANLDVDVAVNNQERYFTEEYKRMLLGFIASDFLDFDVVEIPVIVMGVPNYDHAAVFMRMEDMYSGKFIVTVDDSKEVLLDVKQCVVLPQPLGTYSYLVVQEIVKSWNETVLICDAGTGTFDVTSVTGNIIKRSLGEKIGAQNAYIDLRNYLIEKFGHMNTITVENMPKLLTSGLLKDGVPNIIKTLPDVQSILKSNFDKMFDFLLRMQFDFDEHSKTVWTGGTSLLHKDLINAKGRNTFVVLDRAQEANVLGFFAIAQNIAESV